MTMNIVELSIRRTFEFLHVGAMSFAKELLGFKLSAHCTDCAAEHVA